MEGEATKINRCNALISWLLPCFFVLFLINNVTITMLALPTKLLVYNFSVKSGFTYYKTNYLHVVWRF